jgi:hypothetical protein
MQFRLCVEEAVELRLQVFVLLCVSMGAGRLGEGEGKHWLFPSGLLNKSKLRKKASTKY